jgi:hypothetical protein
MRISSTSLIEIGSKLGEFEIGSEAYETGGISNMTKLPITKSYQYIRFGYWDKVDVDVLNSLVHSNITFTQEVVDETEYGFPLYMYQYKSKI